MVFEDYALYPRLSVAQNIAFPLKIRRMPRSEIRPRLEKALDMLDLQQFRDENVQRPSGGGQRRVSIGRAPARVSARRAARLFCPVALKASRRP